MTKTVILHHKDCADGFGAAWWLRRCLGGDVGTEVELVPMNWHEEPPLESCIMAHVWSVDYCPDAEWLALIGRNAKTFTVLDHHQSSLAEPPKAGYEVITDIDAFCEIAELGAAPRTSIVIDQTYSGVGLVTRVMQREMGLIPPQFLRNVEDRDLWRFYFADTKDVCAAVEATPKTIQAWDELMLAGHAELIVEGQAINRYRDLLIEKTAQSYVHILLMRDNRWGFEVPCAVAPYMIGSDVAGLLAERDSEGIGAYAIFHADHVQIGLRSRNDGPDVAVIAENYGGGGHKHASGLTMSYKAFLETVCSE